MKTHLIFSMTADQILSLNWNPTKNERTTLCLVCAGGNDFAVHHFYYIYLPETSERSEPLESYISFSQQYLHTYRYLHQACRYEKDSYPIFVKTCAMIFVQS